MMVLLESPWPVLTAAIAIELVLLIAVLRSGRGLLLAIMAGVAVLAGTLLALEHLVVTDREHVENALDGIAAGLMKNDAEAVLVHVSPTAAEIHQIVRGTLPQVAITHASIGGDLAIEVSAESAPPTAVARFTARVDGKFKSGSVPYEHFIQRFEVSFIKHDGRWVVVSFREIDRKR